MSTLVHFSSAAPQAIRSGQTLLAIGLAISILAPTRAEEDAASLRDAAGAWSLQSPESEAEQIEELRNQCRSAATYGRGCLYDLIGSLAFGGPGKEPLHLTREQAEAIWSLDGLAQSMPGTSHQADADHPARDLSSYQAYLERSEARRKEALRQAHRLVTLGLLSESQAAVVIQRWMSSHGKLLTLRDENYQDLLAMTSEQKRVFAEALAAYERSHNRMNVLTRIPELSEDREIRALINEAFAAAVNGLLTPQQHERWAQLTAAPAQPVAPPNETQSIAADEAADLLNGSHVFGLLARQADSLGLSDKQAALLHRLREVTQNGLQWISAGPRQGPFPAGDARNDPTDPIGQTRAEFIRSAERVALFGVLTQDQAQLVQTFLMAH